MLCVGSFLSDEQFQCSICLDVFDNPVSTPCGHSFCMTCIVDYWNGVKFYQCPLCKESFKKKPELHINRTLREITEQFKKMKAEAGACGGLGWGEIQRSGVEDKTLKQRQLPGDLFVELKRRFLKPSPTNGAHEGQALLLQQTMVEADDGDSLQHQQLMKKLSLRRYTLSGPADVRHVPLCEKHHQKLELFCKSDGECICSVCSTSEHISHTVISAEKEWLNSKTQISITETKVQEMIELRQKKLEELKLSLEEIKMSVERETQNCLRVFGTLLTSLERSQAELLEGIEINRRAAEHQAEGMMRELELELTELKKRSQGLSQLTQTDDCINGLRSYSNLNTSMTMKEWAGVSVTFNPGTKPIYRSLCHLLEGFQEELRRLQEACVPGLNGRSLKPQPKVKKLQEYAVNVTLNPSTAHPRLILSEDKKKVRCGDKHQPVPSNPERFDCMVCVLGQESFTSGRHYWEVEVGSKTDWDLGVASHSINRKGKVIFNPSNGYWFLSLRNKTNYAFGMDMSTPIPLIQKPQKIGVFVDYEEGQVSFYNVDAKIHIYTFTGMFCEPIYPFFSPCTNKSGKNDAPLIITPVLLPV